MAVKKWRGRWVVDFVLGDQRIRRVSPVQTKRGAQAYEGELRLELTSAAQATATASCSEPPTLAEFADEWMTTYVAVNNKPSERERKALTLRKHLAPFFGNLRLDQITRRPIEAFKAEQVRTGLKASTINRQLTMLGCMLRCAAEWGLIAEAPRTKPLPEVESDFDWLRPDEVRRLLDAAKGLGLRWFTFLFVALHAGLRRGEILALRWGAIDLDARRLTVEHTAWKGELVAPKSGRSRIVPLTAELTAALRRWQRVCAGEVVFPNRQGQVAVSHTCVTYAMNRALALAGLRHIRFHDLRHTFASNLVLKGRSLKEVQLLLGHHSVTMTERYAHIGDDQLAQAVSALDGLTPSDEDEGQEG